MAKGINFRKLRLILDCFLLVAVIWVIIARIQPIQASAGTQSSTQWLVNASSQDPDWQPQASGTVDVTQVITSSVPLDDITLAAMMAAENAALTSPQYLTGLPIIRR